MVPLDEEIQSLIAQITAAFQDVCRGDGTSLHETNVLDDYGDETERLAARRLDTDIHWREIPDEVMDHHRFFFGYLDDQGLRYYLPAWMIYSLKHLGDPRDGHTNTLDDTLLVLTLMDQPNLAEWGRKKWDILSAEQNQAICHYLRYVAQHDPDERNVRDAAKGLRQYWGQFCANDRVEQG